MPRRLAFPPVDIQFHSGADDGARRGPGRGPDRPRQARGLPAKRIVPGPSDRRDGLVAAGLGHARCGSIDSSGNAGASFAAYAARGELRLRLFVPADASPAKLLQARAHGAVVVSVPESRAAAGEEARRALEDAGPEVAYASHLSQPAFLAGTATFAQRGVRTAGGRAPDAGRSPGRRRCSSAPISVSAGCGQRA